MSHTARRADFPSNFNQQRSMDPLSGPDAKKARWSPTSFPASGNPNGMSPNNSAQRDAFANYGYGPQASINQAGFSPSPTSNFSGSPLYSTPNLSINTQTNGNGMQPQMSPSSASAFAQQQQQQQQPNGNAYGTFTGYNMLGMGFPGMNMLGGFPYNGGQMGNFGQVGPVTYSIDRSR
jgi:hypothetical protein